MPTRHPGSYTERQRRLEKRRLSTPGPAPLKPELKRKRPITVLVSDEDYVAIEKRAQAVGMTLSSYGRARMLGDSENGK